MCRHHLALGTYVVIEGETDYAAPGCFKEYAIAAGSRRTGFAALYRPIHMIGLELGVSVASVALRGGADRCADGLPFGCRRRRQALR